MKKSTTTLIVALCLIIAGIAIACAAMSMIGFDFDKLGNESYETVTHTVDGSFEHIVIATQIHDINLAPSEDGVCKVVGSESENIKIKVECDGNFLNIKTEDSRKWYDLIGINLGKAELTLYLPESAYTSLTVASDTGHVNIPDGFGFQGASAATATGAIAFRASVDGELALASDTGSISVGNQKLSKLDAETATGRITLENIEAEGNVRAESDTGRLELHGVKCKSLEAETTTGGITLKNIVAESDIEVNTDTGSVSMVSCLSNYIQIETDTGNVKLDSSDAETIEIETDTGNVEGSLLSPKIFETHTDTGKVRVPQSSEGGLCKVSTSTGNIYISIGD